MKSRQQWIVMQCAIIAMCASMASANVIMNGGFEANVDGTQVTGADYVDTATISSWRAFAVGGAGATYAVSSAAARTGAVGISMAYDTAGADTALDKEDHWETIPTQQRIYKYTVDMRDAGVYGGTPTMFYQATFPSHAGDRVYTTDPQAQWETAGFTVVSDGSGQIGARLTVGAPGRSMHLDNVTITDVTNSNRMVNGGFENSDLRPIDWRFVNVAGATGSATLSNDAASGNNAILFERTNTAGVSQLDLDDPALRLAALPGETLNVNFASKKVSGGVDSSLAMTVAMFNAAGTHLGNAFFGSFLPTDDAYSTFGTSVTMSHPDVAFMTVVFNIRDTGNPGVPSLGAYLIDDIVVIPEPGTLALLAAGLVWGSSKRRRASRRG